jgi:hypothetical protein
MTMKRGQSIEITSDAVKIRAHGATITVRLDDTDYLVAVNRDAGSGPTETIPRRES